MSVSLDRAVEAIVRGAQAVYPDQTALRERLERCLKTGETLNVKLGCDPSRPDLHLGHAIVLRKMRTFQDLGHRVTMIVGDFTAMIGDPTGRSKTRPAITLEEARRNGQTYFDQVGIILDKSKVTIRHNSEWLGSLTAEDFIRLLSRVTVARVLDRDDFQQRYREGIPIGMHELLYPLMQAYDSVAIGSDVELGGTDQTFNNLLGRDLQREFGQEPQLVVITPLLVGVDGVEKMSKSLDNAIGIADPPELMFKLLMQVPDNVLGDYLLHCTDFDDSRRQELLAGDAVQAHRVLARQVVDRYHGPAAAAFAEARYNQVAGGGIPEDIPVIRVPANALTSGSRLRLPRALVLAGLAPSTSEARRLVGNRGVKVGGTLVEDPNQELALPVVLQVGKDRFRRLVA